MMSNNPMSDETIEKILNRYGFNSEERESIRQLLEEFRNHPLVCPTFVRGLIAGAMDAFKIIKERNGTP